LRNVESDAQVALQCSFAGVEEQLTAMKEAHSSLAASLCEQSSKPRFIQNFRKLMGAAEPLLSLPPPPSCSSDLTLDLRVLPPVDAIGITYGGSDRAVRSRPSEPCLPSPVAAAPSSASPVRTAPAQTAPHHNAQCEPWRVPPLLSMPGLGAESGGRDSGSGGLPARREDSRACRPVGATELIARGYSPRNMPEYFEPRPSDRNLRALHASRASPREAKTARFVPPSMRHPELVTEHTHTPGLVKAARTLPQGAYDHRDKIIHELTRSYQASTRD
jgi:hypothetical protein